jgi:hypothetical protein
MNFVKPSLLKSAKIILTLIIAWIFHFIIPYAKTVPINRAWIYYQPRVDQLEIISVPPSQPKIVKT